MFAQISAITFFCDTPVLTKIKAVIKNTHSKENS
jgi:hypothetical protein